MQAEATLIVTADDYGYAAGYNRGILVAVEAGAVDCVGAMVCRPACDPAPLLVAGTEVGLHLELDRDGLQAQLERFERGFGRPPAYMDGHHHCHAREDVAERVAELAAARGIPVRSVSASHRALLRAHGCATPDRLVGRLDPAEPALPPLLAGDGPLPPGVTEWMVHPGYSDPSSGSSYDRAREQDLELVLRLSDSLSRRARRAGPSAL
jgi:predicted glycoside hydrolase/deacetylase ChbG (UPF0249 family)